MERTRPRRHREIEEGFRGGNEAIEEAARLVGSDAPRPFLCECSALSCTETIPLTEGEYEAVRQVDMFVLLPGHETPDVEDVVEHRGDYVVVRKRAASLR